MNSIISSTLPQAAPVSLVPAATPAEARLDTGALLTPAMQVAFASVLSRAMQPTGPGAGSSPSAPVDVTGAFESLCEALAPAIGTIPLTAADGLLAAATPRCPAADAAPPTAVAIGSSVLPAHPQAASPSPSTATDALRALVARVAGDQPATRSHGDQPDPIDHDRTDRDRAKGDVVDSSSPAATVATHRSAAELDPTLVVRDLSPLQPDFRAKLDRVVSRMKDEFGHDVTVAETWRSQTRQDHLYEQGRSRPGAVVTWTHRSEHTDGRAADLIVDGRWDNADGYAHLMQVAQEEGLQTLGARDPGHVAVPGAPVPTAKFLATIAAAATITDVGVAALKATRAGDQIVDTARTNGARRAGTDQVVEIAPSGRVAAVATVAAVAAVAALAPVAQAARVATTATPAATAAVSVATPVAAASPRDGAGRDDRRHDSSDRRADDTTGVAGRARLLADAEHAAPDSRSFATTATRHFAATVAPELVRAADAGTRAEQVMALQDARSAQPMSHMLLRLDNGNGGEDRVRVDVRGTAVGATIDVRDPDAAAQLTDRMPDLTRALESRGLEADALRVRSASTVGLIPSSDIARAVAASGEPATLRRGSLFTESTSQSSNSRHGPDDQRSQQDPSRHRSRREQQGEQQ